MDQKQLIELFHKFKNIMEGAQWEKHRTIIKILLYCLYLLIESKGPTEEYFEFFSHGFDHSISL
jgi:hypothetical protein